MTVDTVLVTGAFGQIGRRCVAVLSERGRTVIATDLYTEGNAATAAELRAGAAPGALVTEWADLLDPAAMRAVLNRHRPGAVVHLAALFSPSSYRNPRLARKVNVGGTRALVTAAAALPEPPLLLKASSAAVYGSRNPYRYPQRITPETPVNPIDQYGEDKVLAEAVIRGSGLPHAMLRLAGVISPDGMANFDRDYLTLMQATPRDNRVHTVDARDVALAFANAVDRAGQIDGKVLLIAGDSSHLHLQRDLEDDMLAAVGIGPLGTSAGLPGDPGDDRGWSFTGWFDTSESQALLDYQRHDWAQTCAWVAESQGRRRQVVTMFAPALRPALRLTLAAMRRRDRRGRYADPWTLISRRYGPDVLAPTDF